jgi:hypothetical protein
VIVRVGMTTSSWAPWRVNGASQPLTRIDVGLSAKSRLNCERSAVAFARIVVVPLNRSVSGQYRRRMS